MTDAATVEGQAADRAGPAEPKPTGISALPQRHATEFSITAAGGAIYLSFGNALIVVDASGTPKGPLAKEWFSTIVLSPESFQQFVTSSQHVLEAYKQQWGSPPELPVSDMRQEGPPNK